MIKIVSKGYETTFNPNSLIYIYIYFYVVWGLENVEHKAITFETEHK